MRLISREFRVQTGKYPFSCAYPTLRTPWSMRRVSQLKRWSRPVSRVLYVLRRDSHSSRPDVAVWLQQPTREQRGPRYRSPIWSCSEWGLPCRTTLTPYAVRSYRTLSPLPVPLRAIGGLLSVALAVSSRCPGVTWHSALWSPDFPRCTCVRRDCPADSTCKCTGWEWGMGSGKSTPPLTILYSRFPIPDS